MDNIFIERKSDGFYTLYCCNENKIVDVGMDKQDLVNLAHTI